MQRTAASNSIDHADIEQSGIAVVVIGRNEGQRLAACFESIKQAEGVGVKELIYVDSGSTDDSCEIAVRYGATVIVVQTERPTAACGRNAGWRRATSELILFLDGDTVLNPKFARAACNEFARSSELAAVWGHRREIHPGNSIYNRILDLDWVYPPGLSEFCGGDAMMRRKVLVETDGFDARLIAGEEPELCRRIRSRGYKILHIDCPMTGHDLQITRLSQYWRRATRAGHAYAEVSERFRESNDPFWTSERRQNIVRGSTWIVSLTAAVAGAVSYGPIPLVLWLLLLLLLSVRSAWKARWKQAAPGVLLLYGLHSHLQQIPILFGQLQYEIGKRRRVPRQLIEYKNNPAD